jgi:hypothetical protein
MNQSKLDDNDKTDGDDEKNDATIRTRASPTQLFHGQVQGQPLFGLAPK